MAGIYYRRRGRRRFRGKAGGRPYFIVLTFVLVLFGTAAYYYRNPPAAAVMSRMAEQSRLGIIGPNAWLQILSQVIPGFRDMVQIAPEQNEAAVWSERHQRISALIELRDPKNILAVQIPYMREIQEQSDPVISQPDGWEQPPEGTPRREPKIVLPLSNTVNNKDKIIIYHTHTTESFVPTSGRSFTDDLDKSVARLGMELAEILSREHRITVLHDKTIHDIPRRTGSYDRALDTIQKLLADNPDTRLVIDLHRDGVARSVSTMEVNNRSLGRVLFIVGAKHARWQENNRRAVLLHNKLEEMAPGITRGVDIVHPLHYNQHVHPGALLIELAGYKNSLEEARRTLPYLAKAIADLYFSGI